MSDAVKVARRIVAAYHAGGSPLHGDCHWVAVAYLETVAALQRVRSQAHNLPRTATADTIVCLIDAALSNADTEGKG